MLICKMYTANYIHNYHFLFNGEKYNIHSIVKLTESGRMYLGSLRNEVILIEQFTNTNGRLWWTYEFKGSALNEGVIRKSTDISPDDLICEVTYPAEIDYAIRERLGINAPNYTIGQKHIPKDLDIQELKSSWIIFICIFIGAAIFKDWYIQLIIRIASGWIFSIYRKRYIDAYTVYTHNKDIDILSKKYEILYGIKK